MSYVNAIPVTHNVFLELQPPKDATMEDILNSLSQHFYISPNRITSKSRKREVVRCRMIGVYLAYQTKRLSLKVIADFFGLGDHASAIYNRDKAKDFIEIEQEFRQDVEQIEKMLYGEGVRMLAA